MKTKETMGCLLLNRYEKHPYHTAIGYIERDEVYHLSYEEFFLTIEKIALSLEELGLKPHDALAILSHTRYEWNIVDLATTCSRGIVVPIYPTYTEEEVEFILQHSKSTIVFVENDHQFYKLLKIYSQLPDLKAVVSFQKLKEEDVSQLPAHIEYLCYQKLLEKGEDRQTHSHRFLQNKIEDIHTDDVASIIYTSGTTGVPKGAVLTQNAFYHMLQNVKLFMQGRVGQQDRSLTFLPLSHVLGRADSLLNLVLENQTIFAESIERVPQNIKLSKPTFIIGVPRIFEKIYDKIMKKVQSGNPLEKAAFDFAFKASKAYFEKIDNDLSPGTFEIIQKNIAYNTVFSKIYEQMGGHIRFLVSGGAPISKEIINFMRFANLPLLEGYGLTETLGPVTLNPLSKQIPGTVGVPMGEVQIGFASDGEILIKTKGMLKEYYKNEEATAEAIDEKGWFHTGDIGELNPEGYIRITDRKKDIIITSGGKNVAPQKIEGIMKLQPHISQFMVVGDQRKYLTAIVGIDKEKLAPAMDGLNLSPEMSLEEIANHPEIRRLVQEDVDAGNQHLARYETIKKFYIAPMEFSIETGLLTPSLKVKKKVVYNKFKDKIDALY